MISGKDLGEAGFKYLGVPYSKMDCQAFVEQCLRDCGLDMNLAGSNAWYREVMKNGVILTPEDCVKQMGKVPAGAFLFIHAFDGGEPEKYRKDGQGNASHIGIVTGLGEGAIHSSASRDCVAESRFRGKTIRGGWNRVGLWDQVVYDYGDGTDVISPEPQPVSVPVQEPAAEYARICSENGWPVNTRKGPGADYGLSKAGKLPVGMLVEILKRQGDWVRIRCTDRNDATWYCWVMGKYLKPVAEESGDEPDLGCWTVIIPHLTLEQAEELVRQFPGAEVKEEEE